ncbi:MAG: DUF2345 domain-containing protein, partial [Telluria sp.]
EILADKEITVISVNDCIEIKAKEKIVLQAGQSAITLEGGNITFACPGKFTVKGSMHTWDSGASAAPALDRLPSQLARAIPDDTTAREYFDEQIIYKDVHGGPIADIPFLVANEDDEGQRLIDKSPLDGVLDRLDTSSAHPLAYSLRFAEFKIKK